ncbi:MAG: M10 family metallopeptidase C-terminal domain-containing protein [Rhodobacteraceae bacterium]|nr:M10 family metallopeptidase C-terminal domain-containing protein [Paracoccaceae bacterium]
MEDVWGSYKSDTLIGNTRDNWLYGDDGNDYLKGLGGDDWITGHFGDDTLEGNAGADRLEGGFGGDVFVYTQASDSTHGAMDVILDWDDQTSWYHGREYDKFDFRELDANPFAGGNQALEWIGEAGFTGIGQIKEVRGAGATYVEVNLDHDVSDSEMIIKIAQTVNLESDDFWV